MSALTRALRFVRRAPAAALIGLGAVAIALYVVAYPLMVVRYPPIVDLPFHAACSSILRHYGDPSWHFREQFSLHFIEVPYWTMWGLAAALNVVMPIGWAVKLTTVLMLGMLPIGLAVFFHGMGKSPLLGMLGLPLVWNGLTHWGFINFVGAIGLMAFAMGLTLRLLRAPSRSKQIGLAITLLLIFVTHVFRFPITLVAVAGVTVIMWPSTRRFKPVIAPLVAAALAMAAWMAVRSDTLKAQHMQWSIHWERYREIPHLLFGSFVGPQELSLAQRSLWVTVAMAAVSTLFFFIERRWRKWHRGDGWWTIGTILVPLVLAAGFFAMFLILPMEIGIWWYVYPREALSGVFMLLGIVPNLPTSKLLRFCMVAALGYTAGNQAFFVAESYHQFGDATEDFQRIVQRIPKAPRLGYMVFDHSGSNRTTTPFIHLPAWVQAEKGGWLSFHFIGWNVAPIRYRKDSPSVPPPTPLRFEWTPERFDMAKRGKFFNWFLVRSVTSPEMRFRSDPSIGLVEHVGTWWLYARKGHENDK